MVSAIGAVTNGIGVALIGVCDSGVVDVLLLFCHGPSSKLCDYIYVIREVVDGVGMGPVLFSESLD